MKPSRRAPSDSRPTSPSRTWTATARPSPRRARRRRSGWPSARSSAGARGRCSRASSRAGATAGASSSSTTSTQMSAIANRVLNWNLMVVDASVPERARQQLGLSHYARARGGRIIALLMPVIVPMNMSFGNYCALFLIPGWRETMALPRAERMVALADPETRRRLQATATSPKAGMFRRLSDFAGYIIGDTFSAANAGLSGRVVRDIAAERGDRARSMRSSTSCSRTSCGPCSGPRRPTTTRPTGRCARASGTIPTSCWPAPTPAPTSIACAAASIRPSSWPTACAGAG